MNEHIKELKRQLEAAAAAEAEARAAAREARAAYRVALVDAKHAEIEATGVKIGVTPLRLFRKRMGEEEEIAGGPYFIIDLEAPRWGSDVELVFAKAKKDGSPSKSKTCVWISRYEPITPDRSA